MYSHHWGIEHRWTWLKAEDRSAERWWVLAAGRKSASLTWRKNCCWSVVPHLFEGLTRFAYVPPSMPQNSQKTWIAMFKQVKIYRCTLVEIVALSLLHPVSTVSRLPNDSPSRLYPAKGTASFGSRAFSQPALPGRKRPNFHLNVFESGINDY